MNGKICTDCKVEKELTEYYQYKTGARKGEYYSICKECKAFRRKVYLRTREKREPPATKTCCDCRLEKDYSLFRKHKNYADGTMPMCLDCYNIRRRAYRARPEVKLKTKISDKYRNIRKNYGLSKEEYLEFIRENPCCVICKVSFSKERSVIDHCHVSGEIRGLLCNRCNRLLGFAQDSTEILKSAIDYLNKFKNDLVSSSNGTSND